MFFQTAHLATRQWLQTNQEYMEHYNDTIHTNLCNILIRNQGRQLKIRQIQIYSLLHG